MPPILTSDADLAAPGFGSGYGYDGTPNDSGTSDEAIACLLEMAALKLKCLSVWKRLTTWTGEVFKGVTEYDPVTERGLRSYMQDLASAAAGSIKNAARIGIADTVDAKLLAYMLDLFIRVNNNWASPSRSIRPAYRAAIPEATRNAMLIKSRELDKNMLAQS